MPSPGTSAATKQEAVVNAARDLIENGWATWASGSPEIVKREDALIEAVDEYDKAVRRAGT